MNEAWDDDLHKVLFGNGDDEFFAETPLDSLCNMGSPGPLKDMLYQNDQWIPPMANTAHNDLPSPISIPMRFDPPMASPYPYPADDSLDSCDDSLDSPIESIHDEPQSRERKRRYKKSEPIAIRGFSDTTARKKHKNAPKSTSFEPHLFWSSLPYAGLPRVSAPKRGGKFDTLAKEYAEQNPNTWIPRNDLVQACNLSETQAHNMRGQLIPKLCSMKKTMLHPLDPSKPPPCNTLLLAQKDKGTEIYFCVVVNERVKRRAHTEENPPQRAQAFDQWKPVKSMEPYYRNAAEQSVAAAAANAIRAFQMEHWG